MYTATHSEWREAAQTAVRNSLPEDWSYTLATLEPTDEDAFFDEDVVAQHWIQPIKVIQPEKRQVQVRVEVEKDGGKYKAETRGPPTI